jgi:hypothetical protein
VHRYIAVDFIGNDLGSRVTQHFPTDLELLEAVAGIVLS